jgi:plasmid stabilization system protein ParE
MAKRYKVIWTQESKNQVDNILSFLKHKWSEKEASDFLDLLLHFELTISQFPKSFKESSKFKGCRLGLVHRHVTAVYKLSGKEITILTVLDNRSHIEK